MSKQWQVTEWPSLKKGEEGEEGKREGEKEEVDIYVIPLGALLLVWWKVERIKY